MQCPIDQRELVMSERQGIEIDYCPECRGVWLDRGELDKLVQRSADDDWRGDDRPTITGSYRRDDDDDDDRRRGHGKPKKRSSFLSEMFDFG